MFKAWKKRWCILYLSQRELFVQYYENEDSARGSSPPKSTVSLKFCEKVDVDLEHSHYKYVFAIHLPERIYYFSAPSFFEMNEWVDAICTHLRLRNACKPVTVTQSATMPRIGGNDNIYGSGGIVCASQYGTLYSMQTNPTLSPNTFSVGSPSVSGNVSPTFEGATYSILSPIPPPRSYSPILSGNMISPPLNTSNRMSPMLNRSLPPTPDSSFEIPPIVPPRKSSIEPEGPPVPPRSHSTTVPNVYLSTPTR